MPTDVPTNRKIDNLENSEIWPVEFSMFNLKMMYLSCPSSDSVIYVSKSGLGYVLFKIKDILKIKL